MKKREPWHGQCQWVDSCSYGYITGSCEKRCPSPRHCRKDCTGALVAAGCRKGKEDEELRGDEHALWCDKGGVGSNGSSNFGVPKNPFHAAFDAPLTFAGFGGAVTAPRSWCPVEDSYSGYWSASF
jgi:hypothetical protein